MSRLVVCYRRWMLAWFAPLLLIAHTLVTACVPAPILLLSQHDHIFIGKITAEAWIAHQQWHLKQVGGRYTEAQPAQPSTPATGTILSAKGCDLQALQAYYGISRTIANCAITLDARLVLVIERMLSLHPPLMQAADLRVPAPPPRFL